jgi:hypothetical protein
MPQKLQLLTQVQAIGRMVGDVDDGAVWVSLFDTFEGQFQHADDRTDISNL